MNRTSERVEGWYTTEMETPLRYWMSTTMTKFKRDVLLKEVSKIFGGCRKIKEAASEQEPFLRAICDAIKFR